MAGQKTLTFLNARYTPVQRKVGVADDAHPAAPFGPADVGRLAPIPPYIYQRDERPWTIFEHAMEGGKAHTAIERRRRRRMRERWENHDKSGRHPRRPPQV